MSLTTREETDMLMALRLQFGDGDPVAMDTVDNEMQQGHEMGDDGVPHAFFQEGDGAAWSDGQVAFDDDYDEEEDHGQEGGPGGVFADWLETFQSVLDCYADRFGERGRVPADADLLGSRAAERLSWARYWLGQLWATTETPPVSTAPAQWDWSLVNALACWPYSGFQVPDRDCFLGFLSYAFGCTCHAFDDPSVLRMLDHLVALTARMPSRADVHHGLVFALHNRGRLPSVRELSELAENAKQMEDDAVDYYTRTKVPTGVSDEVLASLSVERVQVPAESKGGRRRPRPAPTRALRRVRDHVQQRRRRRRERPGAGAHASPSSSSSSAPALESCGMCQGEISAGQALVRLPDCGHVFHSDGADCLGPDDGTVRKWLRSDKRCPDCRTAVCDAPARALAATDPT